ncbi:MAG: hypothetical protein O3B41_07980 [Bacteroidetes bacterium]|nr:hypothetical protein [Bacteroidota bacterium]
MKQEKEALDRIVQIVASVPKNDARFLSVATIIGTMLRRVLSAEKALEAASISLAQRTKMEHFRNETSRMIEVLGAEMPQHISLSTVVALEEPSWWFALSETTHVLEECVEQLSGMVSKQEKGSAVRDLTAQCVSLLRDHYNEYLLEARNWMDA